MLNIRSALPVSRRPLMAENLNGKLEAGTVKLETGNENHE
jgi:hypothetical protein